MQTQKFTGGYCYGFNNMSKDDELSGTGNSYDFGARIYDARLGRWMSCDPLFGRYTSLSPYNFVNGLVTIAIDPNGEEIVILGTKKYRRQVIRTLAKLAKESSTARMLITTIANSKTHRLIINDGGVEYGNFLSPKVRETDENNNKVTNKILYFNFASANGPLLEGPNHDKKTFRNEQTELAHELAHDYLEITGQNLVGSFSDVPGVAIDEISTVVNYENKIRIEMHYEIREYYDKIPVLEMDAKLNVNKSEKTWTLAKRPEKITYDINSIQKNNTKLNDQKSQNYGTIDGGLIFLGNTFNIISNHKPNTSFGYRNVGKSDFPNYDFNKKNMDSAQTTLKSKD